MEGKISELQKEQIEKSEYPVVGAKYNNEYNYFICNSNHIKTKSKKY